MGIKYLKLSLLIFSFVNSVILILIRTRVGYMVKHSLGLRPWEILRAQVIFTVHPDSRPNTDIIHFLTIVY